MTSQWSQLLNRIVLGKDIPSPLSEWFTQVLPEKSFDTKISAMFIAYPNCRKSFAFALLESAQKALKIPNLSQSPKASLIMYALTLLVETHPRYFQKLYDFQSADSKLIENAVAANFYSILQSRSDLLYQEAYLQNIPLTQLVENYNITCEKAFECFKIIESITQQISKSAPLEEDLFQPEPSPNKKICKQNKEQIYIHQTMEINLSTLNSTMEQNSFAFLFGLLGSGKSQLVKTYAHDQMIIRIDLDSSVDFGSLLGSYACTQKAGVFEYREGPLLFAVRGGHLLVLENVQEASEDVLNGLCTLLKDKFIRSQGQAVYTNPKFKMIGIASCDSESACVRAMKQFELIFKTALIQLKQIELEDYHFVLEKKYPALFVGRLKSISYGIIEIFFKISSLRDVDKLFKRISYIFMAHFGQEIVENVYLTEEIRRKFFLEIYEVMLAGVLKKTIDQSIVVNCLSLLGLENQEFDLLTTKYDCFMSESETFIQSYKLGQISRKIFNQTIQPLQSKIVYTSYSSQILEKIITCIIQKEPCLLISDTGCGKTTLTQHCAQLFGQRLRVFNLSEGADAQDLVGGFRPLDLQALSGITLKKFLKHFLSIADPNSNSVFVQKLQSLLQQRKLGILYKAMLKTIEQVLQTSKRPSVWNKLANQLISLQQALKSEPSNQVGFYFLTGALIKAMQKGQWVLIDEINLASNELLQKLIPAAEGSEFLFLEHGDHVPLKVHENFRVIACMNPGCDFGKKELPVNVKKKFTSIYLEEMTDLGDLNIFVRGILGDLFQKTQIQIAPLYLKLKQSAQFNELAATVGGVHYSLRNLARSLQYIKYMENSNMDRILFNALALGFGSGLNQESWKSFLQILMKQGIDGNKFLPKSASEFQFRTHDKTIEILGFHVTRGRKLPYCNPEFLVTDGNIHSLLQLLRSISGSGLPVLLEGPTSAGKTSLVKFVADLCGQLCHRINNHQNTEIEEYIGTYTSSADGKIRFQEGLLVQAIRNGDWVILDELNLARSEILENLNRLLDDNNELFLPETQETIKPHKGFRIFATQNPVTYAGRRMLSKAFRNRFIQIEVPDASPADMQSILQKRCPNVPPSHVPLMLQVYKDLNLYRSSERLFMQLGGMITLRDLIKWGNRIGNASSQYIQSTKEELAIEGYCLLGERLRDLELKANVQKILEKIFKIEINPQIYYDTYLKRNIQIDPKVFKIQLNTAFIRMAALAHKALSNHEPALLIGPAGIGKTTLTQLFSHSLRSQHYQIVAHQYMEVSDFVGSLRPNRQGSQSQTFFLWEDGPLLQAIKNGGVFLIDEINMAPESVLEGLNSVLEIPPSLTVNEQQYIAPSHVPFVIIGAMNPSGDWGKKELTPALRSRFTEIYAENPLNCDLTNLQNIVEQFIPQMYQQISKVIFVYNQQLKVQYSLQELTFRDLINIKNTLGILDNLTDHEKLFHTLEVNIFMALENSIDANIFKEIRNKLISSSDLQDMDIKKQIQKIIQNDKTLLGAHPFFTEIVQTQEDNNTFVLESDQAQENLLKLIKAITLDGKPLMLQGPPSSGKTAAIQYLAKLKGKRLQVILVDEHTDLSELLGTDQPSNQPNQKFSFVYGPLLKALLDGDWVVLKHLNLAPQNIIEGLNSIFDHRQEVFIPETNETYQVHPQTRIFVVQNPTGQGRKNLPASFLNRFIKLNFVSYTHEDQIRIASKLNPQIDFELISEHHQIIQKAEPGFMNLVSYLKYFKTYLYSKDLLLSIKSSLNFQYQTSQKQMISLLNLNPKRSWDDEIELHALTREFHQQNLKETAQTLFKLLEISEFTNVIGIYIQGQSGVGKRFCIKKLAEIKKKKVRFLSLSSTSDSQDILGSYQQYNQETLHVENQKVLSRVIKQLIPHIKNSETIRYLYNLLKKHTLNFNEVIQELKRIENSQMLDEAIIQQLLNGVQTLSHKEDQNEIFVWAYSEFIKAAEQGDWIVIENIDRINPTLLPKLNSLASLNINQQLPLLYGNKNQINIHKNFRIFFTDNINEVYSQNQSFRYLNINLDSLKSQCYTICIDKDFNNIANPIELLQYEQKESILSHIHFQFPINSKIIQNTIRFQIQHQFINDLELISVEKLTLLYFWQRILKNIQDHQLLGNIQNQYIQQSLQNFNLVFQNSLNQIKQLYIIQFIKLSQNIRKKIESMIAFIQALKTDNYMNLIFLNMLMVSLSESIELKINETKLILLFTVFFIFIDKINQIQLLNYQLFQPFEGYELYQGNYSENLKQFQQVQKLSLFKNELQWATIVTINNAFPNFYFKNQMIMENQFLQKKWIFLVLVEISRKNPRFTSQIFIHFQSLSNNTQDYSIISQILNTNVLEKESEIQTFDDFINLNYILPDTQSDPIQQINEDNQNLNGFSSFICVNDNQISLLIRYMMRILSISQKSELQISIDKLHSSLEYQNEPIHDQNFINYWINQVINLTNYIQTQSLLILEEVNIQENEKQQMTDKIFSNFYTPEDILHLQLDRQTYLQIQMLKFKNKLENIDQILKCYFESILCSNLIELQLMKPVSKRLFEAVSQNYYLKHRFFEQSTDCTLSEYLRSNKNQLKNSINKFLNNFEQSDDQLQQIIEIFKESIQIFKFDHQELQKIALILNQEYVTYAFTQQIEQFINNLIKQDRNISFIWINKAQEPNQNLQIIKQQIENLVKIQSTQVNLRSHDENSISASENFLSFNQEHYQRLIDLSDNLKTSQDRQTVFQFQHYATNFIIQNYSKFWLGFKDVLYPIFQSLYLLIQLTENTQEQNKTTLISRSLLQKIQLNYPDQEILMQASQEILYDSIDKDDQLGTANFKKYIQDELNNLIRSEYEEVVDKEEEEKVSREKLHKLISRSLNEIEMISNELTKKIMLKKLVETPLTKLMIQRFNISSSPLVEINKQRLFIDDQADSIFKTQLQLNSQENLDQKISFFITIQKINESIGQISTQIKQRYDDILFSDNQVLLDLMQFVRNLQNQPSFQSSLRKISSSLLQLYKKLESWNTIVPRQYKINLETGEFLILLSKLLRDQKLDFEVALVNRVEQLWHVEAIISVKFFKQLLTLNEPNNNEIQIYNTINSFLINQSVVSFDLRLSFLILIQKFNCLNSLIKNIIQQIICIYSIFRPAHGEYIQAILNEYLDIFKEEQRLVSWQSTNIGILEGLVDRLHQKINKQVKKIGQKFQENFKLKVLDAYFPKVLVNDTTSFLNLNQNYIKNDKKQEKYSEILYYTRKGLKIPTLSCVESLKLKRMKIDKRNIEFSSSWVHIECKIQNIFERMKELEEMKAKSNIKQRSLEDFYKYLELTYGLSKQLKGNQVITDIFSKHKFLLQTEMETNYEPQQQALIEKTIQQYYQAVFCLEKLSAQQLATQISKNLQIKGLSFLYDYQQKLQKHINQMMKLQVRIKNQWFIDLKKLPLMSSYKIEQVQNFTSLVEQIKRKQTMLQGLEKEFEFINLKNQYSQIKNILESQIIQFKYQKVHPEIYVVCSQTLDDFIQNLKRAQLILEQCSTQAQGSLGFDTCVINFQVHKFCTSLNQDLGSLLKILFKNNQSQGQYPEAQIQNQIKKNHGRLLLLLKKYQEDLLNCFDEETRNFNSIYKNEFKFLKTIGLIADEMSYYTENILKYHLGGGDIIQLIKSHSSYCQDFSAIYFNSIRNLKAFAKFFNLMTRVLSNILIKGFCSQDEEQEGADGDNLSGLQDGTGVGEGAGKDNVNDQIEHEEQVLGEQKDNNDDDKNIEKESNEMEMENDFDGENQDIGSEEEGSGEDEEEKGHASDEQSQVDATPRESQELERGEEQQQKDRTDQDPEFDGSNREDLQAQDSDIETGEQESEFSLNSNMDLGDEASDEQNNDQEEMDEKESENISQPNNEMSAEENLDVEEQNKEQNDELEEDNLQESFQEEIEEQQDQEEEVSEDKQQYKKDEQNNQQNNNNGQEGKDEDQLEEMDQQQQEEEKQKENQQEKKQNKQNSNNQNNNEAMCQEDPQEQQEGDQENQEIKNDIIQEDFSEINPKLQQVVKMNNQQQQKNDEIVDEFQEASLNNNDNRYNQMTALPSDFNQQNLQDSMVKNQDQNFDGQSKNQITQNDVKAEQSSNILEKKEYYQYDETKIEEEIIQPEQKLQWTHIQSDIILWSSLLCEDLKTILRPTKCQGLKGDYKTGKRLNMKKVIPFIASNFKKDKIWLRRQLPNKCTYQIALALDNSLSMSENNVGLTALQSLLSLALALQKMEAGTIEILKMSNIPEVVKGFHETLGVHQIPSLMDKFSFKEHSDQSQDKGLVHLLEKVFIDFKNIQTYQFEASQIQICFIISDGRFNKNAVRPLLIQAEEEHILFIFIIIDSNDNNKSIYNLKSTSIETVNGKSQVKITKYLEDFPFKYYIVIQDTSKLSSSLTCIIRQYFEMYNI